MITYEEVFERNYRWLKSRKERDKEFFTELARGQDPDFLIIGCSDSRVPLESITGTEPGDLFVHRNIANMVNSDDDSVMSVVNYAVKHLHVKHIVVCGHTQCGGVKASLSHDSDEALDPWLDRIREVAALYQDELNSIEDDAERYQKLIELNTIEQCRNLLDLEVVGESRRKTGYPDVHAWMFDLSSGQLRDMGFRE